MGWLFDRLTGPPFRWLFGISMSYATNARVEPLDEEKAKAHWTEMLRVPEDRTLRAETVGRAYDGAVTRAVRLEAKAIGLLQVVAIGFAVIALVLPRKTVALRVLITVSIVYLVAATWGGLEVLRLRRQRQVLVETAESPSAGMVETAVAAAQLQEVGIRTTNFIAGMLSDLVAAGAAAAIALMLVVWGVGDNHPASNGISPPVSTTSVNRTTTTAQTTP